MQDGFQGTERYKVLDLLGTGGMGAVYHAYDAVRDRSVALKLMRIRGSEEQIAFKREFRNIESLKHPNLVRLFELEETGDALFYTMEVVQGRSLRDLIGPAPRPPTRNARGPRTEPVPEEAPDAPSELRTARLDDEDGPAAASVAPGAKAVVKATAPACPYDVTRDVLRQVLDALEFLHLNGTVHCDLKPDNILIDRDETIKLVDFGIIKVIDSDAVTSWGSSVVGTTEYMAPEQVIRGRIAPATDLYALGCVLFEMVVGRVPFEGAPYAVMTKHRYEEAPRLSGLVEGVPDDLVQVCAGLMAKRPGDRMTIDQIRSVLALPSPRAAPARPSDEKVFVGRGKERALLLDQLAAADGGAAQLAVVRGSSGLGKTALSEELVQSARDQGWVIFRGRCYEREDVPYRAFDRIMDDIALRLRFEMRSSTQAEFNDLKPLSWIFPAFELLRRTTNATWRPFESNPSSTSRMWMDPMERRRQAFGSLDALLDILNDSGPVVFVIDDLQWTDAESMELLDELLERCGNRRLMIVGMYRPEDTGEDHHLTRFLAKRLDEENVREIALQPLLHNEVRALLEAKLGQEVDDLNASFVLEQTNGNPFFVEEVARHVASSPMSDQRLDAHDLPGLSELVRRRFDALASDARELLVLASAAGGAFTVDFMLAASQMESAAFNLAFDELTDNQLLRGAGTAEALGSVAPPAMHDGASRSSVSVRPDRTFDFYHDRLREIAYDGVEATARPAVHERLAVALEGVPGAKAQVMLRHFRVAKNLDKTIRYGLRAAEDAAHQLAFHRAASLFEDVLSDRGRLDTAGSQEHHQQDGQIYERLARCRELGGEPDKAIEALSDAHRELSVARADDKQLQRVHIHLAGDLVKYGRIQDGIHRFLELLRPFGLDVRGTLRQVGLTLLRLRLGIVLADWIPRALRPERAPTVDDRERLAVYDSIIESFAWSWPLVSAEYQMRFQLLADRLTDPDVRARSMMFEALYRALSGQRGTDDARVQEKLEQGAAFARSGDVQTVIYTRGVSAFIDLVFGQWERSIEVLQEVTDEYGSVGASRSWGAQVGKTWLLLAYHYAGHRDLALELAFELLEAGRRSDVVRFGLGAWAMVMDSLHTGQVETAEVLLHEWSLRVPKTPMTHSRSLFEGCRNVLDNVRGQPEAALERIDALDAEVTAAGCTLAAWDQAHWYLPGLEAAVRLGRDGTLTAAQRRVAVRRAKRLIAKTPPFFACLGHRALGLLAHQQGGDKEARTRLLRALEISETAGVPRHRWLCLRAAKEAGLLPDARCEELDRLENTWGYR